MFCLLLWIVCKNYSSIYRMFQTAIMYVSVYKIGTWDFHLSDRSPAKFSCDFEPASRFSHIHHFSCFSILTSRRVRKLLQLFSGSWRKNFRLSMCGHFTGASEQSHMLLSQMNTCISYFSEEWWRFFFGSLKNDNYF